MNTTPITKLPRASRTNTFGVCPICRRQNGVRYENRVNWIVCDTHRVKWTIGSDVVSGWTDLTAEQRFAQIDKLTGYRVVKPFDIREHGTTEERMAYADMMHTAARLGLRVEVYTEYVTDPLDPVDQRTDSEPCPF